MNRTNRIPPIKPLLNFNAPEELVRRLDKLILREGKDRTKHLRIALEEYLERKDGQY